MRPSNVRLARPDEGDAIYQLLLGLYEENGTFSIDHIKTRITIQGLLDPAQGMIGVIDGANGIEGSVGLVIDSQWYSSDQFLLELWCYVIPECRRSTHAKTLIEFAKWASDGLGIPLQMGIISTTQTAAKERLYRRQLQPVGGYFMHGRDRKKQAA